MENDDTRSQGGASEVRFADDDEPNEAEPLDWVGLLRFACIDEKVAPDILDFKHDIITTVSDMASQQAARIEAMESDPDMELERIIFERDLQRTRWLIKSYYRTRIKKIEQFVQYYLHHSEYTGRLSENELEYAKAYFTSIGRHAQRTILVDLPQHFQSFTLQSAASQEEDMIPRPELESTVMTRPLLGGCEININPANASDVMTLNDGDVVVLQYHLVKDQVLNEQLHLC